MVDSVNLKQWAERQGVAYVTARRWFRDGRLPVPARRVGGLILVGEPAADEPAVITAVYARVASAGQRADLDRQVARVTAWAAGNGLPVGKVVTEIGSALNGQRRKFLALLRDRSVTTIIAEHRDLFARVGAEYVEAALSAQGRRLLVVDPSGVDDDHLAGDVTEMLTSLCARVHGQRAAADRARRAVAAVSDG
jgi:predicted site-specific integrase-resolvase